MADEFGDVVSLSPELYLYVPCELVQNTLKNSGDYRKGDSIETFKLLAGEGLFTAQGPLYDQQEKAVKSAFGRKYFTEFRNIIDVELNEYVDQIFSKSKTTDTPFDIIDLSVDLTMSIAARAFFGVAGRNELAQEFRKGLVFVQEWYSKLEAVEFAEPMLQHTEEHFTKFPYFIALQKMIFKKLSGTGDMVQAISEWKKFVADNNEEVLKTAAAMRGVCAQIISLRKNDLDKASKQDVLASLLTLQKDPENTWLTDEAIIDQVATFFVAGHETTSDLFTVLLWKHARGETPAEVIAEVRSTQNVLGDERLLVNLFPKTYDYITAILLEHPPVPFTVRQTNRDLEVGGYSIPKDSKIILSPYVTKDMNVTFGFGRRQCVGRMFAIEEVILGLQHIAQYDLKLVDANQQLEMTQGLTIGYSRGSTPVLAKCIR
jgi:cytochrome P450